MLANNGVKRMEINKVSNYTSLAPNNTQVENISTEKLAEQQANFKQDEVDISLEARALGAGGGGGREEEQVRGQGREGGDRGRRHGVGAARG